MLSAAAFAMLLRLAPLAVLTTRGRWRLIALGAVACTAAAIVGAVLMHR